MPQKAYGRDTHLPGRHSAPVPRLVVLVMLIAYLSLISGCKNALYRAANLPAEFRAEPTANTNTIDYSRIAARGTSESVIAPSDLLDVTITAGSTDEPVTPFGVRVADDGTIDLPVIGKVPVAGMEAVDAAQAVSSAGIERGMYVHPIVTLDIKKKAVNRVTVLGAVKEPGLYELPRGGSTIVSAIAASGGLAEDAGTEIEVVRQSAAQGAGGKVQLTSYHNDVPGAPAGTQAIRLDLSQGNEQAYAAFLLSDQDVVRVVPRKKSTIHVIGLVFKPGQFELPVDQDLRMLDAIALAGGSNSPVADKVIIIRQVDGRSEPLAIQASISKAKHNGAENLQLAPGDTVSVEQTVQTAVVDAFHRFFRMSIGLARDAAF